VVYEGVSKSFRTDGLERELQMVQLSATRCSCIAILWVSLVSFAATVLRVVASQRVFIVVVYVVIDSVRKLLGIPSYIAWYRQGLWPVTWQTCPLDREDALCQTKPHLFDCNQNVVMNPGGAACHDGMTDWLTVSCKVSLTVTIAKMRLNSTRVYPKFPDWVDNEMKQQQ
jgi:hypothetical protein